MISTSSPGRINARIQFQAHRKLDCFRNAQHQLHPAARADARLGGPDIRVHRTDIIFGIGCGAGETTGRRHFSILAKQQEDEASNSSKAVRLVMNSFYRACSLVST